MDRDIPTAPERRYKNGVTAALEICAENRVQENGLMVSAEGNGKRYQVERAAAIIEAAAAKIGAGDVSALEKLCAAHVVALDTIFSEYAKEYAMSQWSHSGMFVALRAQSQCRKMLKTLLSVAAQKKSQNSDDRNIENVNPQT